MKKALLIVVVSLLYLPLFSQLLTWTPNFPVESTTPLDITLDPTKGNGALNAYANTSDVYVHTGVITNLSTSATNWRYVRPGNFNTPVPALNAPYVTGSNPYKWRFTITGGIRNFYGVTDPTEVILKIAILFRNGAGTLVQRNTDGTDMYVPVYDGSLNVRFSLPFFQPTYVPIPETIVKYQGESIPTTAIASTAPASTTMRLYYNGNLVQTAASSSTVSASPFITTAGTQTVVAEATSGASSKRDTFRFFVPTSNIIQALPAGVKDGINYDADPTKVTLVLYAPGKTRVSVIGDIPNSNWSEQTQYQMKISPDGNYWWTTISGLTPGTEYSFQYLVNGALRIADPYTEKVQDPWNDQYISASTYAGLKPYPTGLTSGIVSVLQTNAPGYTWQSNSYTRPDKRNLMVYELLVRDYLANHDWKTLTDTLTYLNRLGINTIELMPVNEFEGNISWGYNPDFYFAPDKYYGPKNELKAFIDSAHKRGIAVVMDIALNHSFGLSPMVQLYFDAANNRPAANNPWFNTVAKHAYNVGYDMNHESLATRYFVSRVVTHWMQEYRIDGFRFDLSKGFTQTQTCDANGANCNAGAMANYDASRIAIWKRYYDTMQLKSPGSYAILEHFAANDEETELANYGLMLWGNLNYNFSEAAMGWVSTSNFDWGLHVARGWSQPYLVTYMESHDEERMMYRNLNYGNINGSYNTRTLETALDRMELSAAFLLTMPGPKMIWQFGELGYDFPINYCQNGTVSSNCRTDPKPIRWDYAGVQGRQDLFNTYRALLQLRNNPLYTEAFTTGFISRNFASGFKWITLNSGGGKVVVMGNFDVTAQTSSVTFPAGGTWYNFLNPPATFAATGTAQSFTLQPGEYRVYLSTNVVLPVTILSFTGMNRGNRNELSWQVEQEQNLAAYVVERSTDGIVFEQAGSVTPTGSRSYVFTDGDISRAPVYFYRLKQLDTDGHFVYSNVIRLNGGLKGISLQVNPNPVNGMVQAKIATAQAGIATVQLTDLCGRQLLQRRVQLNAGVTGINFAETKALAPGTYLLVLTTTEGNATVRILKTN